MTDSVAQQHQTLTSNQFGNKDSFEIYLKFTPSPGQFNQHHDTLTDKLNQLLDHNLTTDQNFTTLRDEAASIKIDVNAVNGLQHENQKIKQHLSVALGKINKLEHKNEIHHQKVVNLEQHSFSKDVVVYNLKENNQETILTLINNIYNIIIDDMKIAKHHVFHPLNPAGEIRIDNCFRIGKRNTNTPRPVIVSFLMQIRKKIVINRSYTKNLSSASKVKISNRYLSEMREKRSVQLDTFKTIQNQKKRHKGHC